MKKLSYHKEEKLNAISHAIGVVLGVVGLYLLLENNTGKSPYARWGIVIYSISIIALYTASTLYHSVSNFELKKKLRILDHISIYILIAGTYTPVALITLVNGNGWLIFYTVWGIAILGSIFKLFYTGKYEYVSLLLYLVMGWQIVFDFQNLLEQSSSMGINLLFLGGAFYTLGIVFYAVRRIPYNHLIWHFFVLGGSISHWAFIYNDVV